MLINLNGLKKTFHSRSLVGLCEGCTLNYVSYYWQSLP